nr:MAG TPA: Loader and inhibitor of phage G40P [Caudoviricetes sp.]
MNKEEFSQVMGVIAAAFPDITISLQTTKTYFEELKDLDYKITCLAVKQLLATSTYFPRIAQIRGKYAELTSPESNISSVDAIGILNKSISHFGRYRTNEALDYIKGQSTALYEIVRAIGFNNICSADMNRFRFEVETLYKESEKSIKEQAMLSGEVRSKIAQLTGKVRANALALEVCDYD